MNKVSIYDAEKYLKIIKHYEDYQCKVNQIKRDSIFPYGPILCLAVRNGREVDLFRFAGYNTFFKEIIKLFEIKEIGFRTRFFSFIDP